MEKLQVLIDDLYNMTASPRKVGNVAIWLNNDNEEQPIVEIVAEINAVSYHYSMKGNQPDGGFSKDMELGIYRLFFTLFNEKFGIKYGG